VVSKPMTEAVCRFCSRSSAWSKTQPSAPPWHQRPSRSNRLFSPDLGRFCRTVEKRRNCAGIMATACTAWAMALSSAGRSGKAGVAMQVRINCSQN